MLNGMEGETRITLDIIISGGSSIFNCVTVIVVRSLGVCIGETDLRGYVQICFVHCTYSRYGTHGLTISHKCFGYSCDHVVKCLVAVDALTV